jgi:acyl-CoA thioesterase
MIRPGSLGADRKRMDRKTLEMMGKQSPYFNHLNMVLEEAEKGYARVSMNIKPHHANIQGVVHGGAIASLADQAAMRAVQTQLPQGQAGRTIQMDMHYLAPARGKHLVGEGRVQKMGRRIAFSDAEVKDDDGSTIATARCTIVIVEDREDKGETGNPQEEWR